MIPDCRHIPVMALSSRLGASIARASIFNQQTPVFRRTLDTIRAGPTSRSSYSTSVRIPKHLFNFRSQSHAYSTVVVQNIPRSRARRLVSFLLISGASFTVGGYLALLYAPPLLTPLIMGSIPTDADTLNYKAPDEFAKEIDEHIKNSALARSLRANPDFVESRPHLKIPAEVRQHNLTAGTLSGPGMIVVPPYIFNEKGGKSMVCIFYVGSDLSGHPGIVHGGFLATMLDEGLARCAFPAMPNKVGVTANLTIDYRTPTFASQFLVLRAKTTKTEGRKAWAEGWIESLDVVEGEDPTKLVEASALFIEPKHAKIMKSLYRIAT